MTSIAFFLFRSMMFFFVPAASCVRRRVVVVYRRKKLIYFLIPTLDRLYNKAVSKSNKEDQTAATA